MEPPALATADVSDAAGGDIAMDPRIRPMWKGARLVGPAFTVRTPAGQHRAVTRALESAGPGDVIVIDAAGDVARALWGDRMSLLAQERGIAGVVVLPRASEDDVLRRLTAGAPSPVGYVQGLLEAAGNRGPSTE